MELRPQIQKWLFLPHQQRHLPCKTAQQPSGPVSCTQPSQGRAVRLIARTGTLGRTEESPFAELRRSGVQEEPMSLQHVCSVNKEKIALFQPQAASCLLLTEYRRLHSSGTLLKLLD